MKLSNSNLVVTPINLSPSYLTNLVKEIVVGSTTGYTSACNQITFDGLDGNADGGYILECEINNESGSSKNVRLFCNNDTTATNYYREIIRGTSSTLGNLNSNDPNLIYTATGVITFSNINISPSFVVNSQSGNKNAGTDGHVMIGTIWKTSNPANITRLDIACEDSTTIFGIGSKFKLYRKNINPSLILTNRYLSNMVEEKRITEDCSSVTFTGLNSLEDGDYYLSGTLLNAYTSDVAICAFINGDEVLNNYTSKYFQADDSTISTGVSSYKAGCADSIASLHSTFEVKFSVCNGYVLYDCRSIMQTASSTNMKIINRASRTLTTVSAINTITLKSYYLGSPTLVTGIKAGSVFRLYKSNSAAVRPGPGFSAHKNGTNQTGIVADWSSTKITFTTEEWDTHNCYDVANSRFTPTIAGIYQITSAVRFTTQPDNASGGRWAIILFKNGVKYKESAYAGYPGYGPENLVVQVYLNGSTDYIEVFVAGSDNTTKEINGNAAATYFQAQKIG